MRFIAGVGVCIMLIAAAVCVAFAVFMWLNIQSPVTHQEPRTSAQTSEDPQYIEAPAVEPAVWIPVIPPADDFYVQYVYLLGGPDEYDEPEEYEYISAEYENLNPSAILAPPIPEEYTALLFYIHGNASLYAEFAQARPDLDIETVIWKVNASVHVPFYSQIRINHDPNPLLITPAYRLPYGFEPRELVPVNSDTCQLRAKPEAVAAFRLMRASAREAGFALTVVSAFRTPERQHQNWINRGRRDHIVARAHHSEHQTGRALDLGGPGGLLDERAATPTGAWVAANVQYYGFIVRYLAETRHITGVIHEPWHITYVGTTISMYMYENNIISLEEFVGRNPGVGLDW